MPCANCPCRRGCLRRGRRRWRPSCRPWGLGFPGPHPSRSAGTSLRASATAARRADTCTERRDGERARETEQGMLPLVCAVVREITNREQAYNWASKHTSKQGKKSNASKQASKATQAKQRKQASKATQATQEIQAKQRKQATQATQASNASKQRKHATQAKQASKAAQASKQTSGSGGIFVYLSLPLVRRNF